MMKIIYFTSPKEEPENQNQWIYWVLGIVPDSVDEYLPPHLKFPIIINGDPEPSGLMDSDDFIEPIAKWPFKPTEKLMKMFIRTCFK
jgi:hypothetical protein